MELFWVTVVSYSRNILPWFGLGTVVAYMVDRKVDIRMIHLLLGKISFRNVLAAQVTGMVSPLSIMTALPIAGELVRLGAQPLMLLGFLVAERAYDLQSFFIITNLFGIKMATANALVILVSLVATTWCFRKEKLKFNDRGKKRNGDFWRGQAKTLLIVLAGIVIGAGLRVVIPLTKLGDLMQSELGSVITSLTVGFGLYFGTVLGNYPVAKALADLGMTEAGTLVFLSVVPIFNLVVIILFLSVIKARYVIKMFGIYTLTALTLSLAAAVFV